MSRGDTAPRIDSDEPPEGSYFVSTYPPFSLWSGSGIGAYRRALERPAAAGAPAPLLIYAHVPFCVERCRYCYYLSYDDRPGMMDRYVDSMLGELALYRVAPALSGRRSAAVYVGGGTPSLLSAARIGRLFLGLRAAFPWDDSAEVTFECAPRSVTRAKAAALRAAGVTRLSLGVQQLDDGVLERNGRVHREADVLAAFEAIRAAGFDVVNLDLIVGLPGETDVSFDASLARVIGLAPESVTLYQLEMPLNTPLYRAYREGAPDAAPAPWPVKRARLRRGFARLEAAGYALRSAYAAVRDPERHRFVYQDAQYRGADLLGIGASAFSYLQGHHQQNLAALGPYMAAVAGGALPLWRAHSLTDAELLVRAFVLRLKLGGADAGEFRESFGVDPAARFAGPLDRMSQRGWLTLHHGSVRLTREGLLRVDRLIPEFYLSEHRGRRYS